MSHTFRTIRLPVAPVTRPQREEAVRREQDRLRRELKLLKDKGGWGYIEDPVAEPAEKPSVIVEPVPVIAAKRTVREKRKDAVLRLCVEGMNERGVGKLLRMSDRLVEGYLDELRREHRLGKEHDPVFRQR